MFSIKTSVFLLFFLLVSHFQPSIFTKNKNHGSVLLVEAGFFDDLVDAVEDLGDTIVDAGEDLIDAGTDLIDDIIDTVVDTTTDFVGTVASAFTSLANAITTTAYYAASWLVHLSDTAIEVVRAIYTVGKISADAIEDILDGYNINGTVWDHLADGAKYVLYELDDLTDEITSPIVEYIVKGANLLGDLIDIDDYMIFPFDVVTDDDFYTASDCLDDLVFETAIDFAENVANTLINLGNNGSLDITPLLNTEGIKDELNYTYECLINLAQDIRRRESSNNDPENIIAAAIEDVLDYFEFDELVVGISVSFTACTLVCGTAGIGFAASENGQFGAFYSIASGVETSSVVGASIEAGLHFWPSYSSVAPGESHNIQFELDLPIISLIFSPEISVGIDADDESFDGFSITNDIIDVSLGLNGAFGLGYSYETTYWIVTTSDLENDWVSPNETPTETETPSGDDDDDRPTTTSSTTLTTTAVETLGETLGGGGFISTTTIGLSGTTAASTFSKDVTMACPTTEYKAGNASTLTLGYIQINEVIYGNVSGTNNCNSSSAYGIVYDECAWESSCKIQVSEDNLGASNCPANTQFGLEVIYNCPGQSSVYDLGCYTTNFWEMVDSGWVIDGQYNDQYPFMSDDWETRTNAIGKCSKIAKDKGLPGFAIWNHGMCIINNNLFNEGVYNKYNLTNCPSDSYGNYDGKGSGLAMNLYAFEQEELAFEDLGCYNTSHVLSEWDLITYSSSSSSSKIMNLEKQHYLTQDSYSTRKMAISKCAQIASENGYDGFGLLDGGSCHISNLFNEASLDNLYLSIGLERTNATFDCGNGKGNSLSFSLYTFPYVTLPPSNEAQVSDALTGGQIAMIIIFPLLFIVIVVVVVYYLYRNQLFCFNKNPNRNINSKHLNTNHNAGQTTMHESQMSSDNQGLPGQGSVGVLEKIKSKWALRKGRRGSVDQKGTVNYIAKETIDETHITAPGATNTVNPGEAIQEVNDDEDTENGPPLPPGSNKLGPVDAAAAAGVYVAKPPPPSNNINNNNDDIAPGAPANNRPPPPAPVQQSSQYQRQESDFDDPSQQNNENININNNNNNNNEDELYHQYPDEEVTVGL